MPSDAYRIAVDLHGLADRVDDPTLSHASAQLLSAIVEGAVATSRSARRSAWQDAHQGAWATAAVVDRLGREGRLDPVSYQRALRFLDHLEDELGSLSGR